MYIINKNSLPYVGQTGIEVNLNIKIKLLMDLIVLGKHTVFLCTATVV